ncbi:cation ABC transporter substrate-binding protein, partial [Burkholderia pseudomallei]|nr:cation ABC transporter substrate-binding protein [Burkholderia pseudomallei]
MSLAAAPRMFASCSSRSPSAPLALRASPLLRAARALAAGVAALALASAAFAQNATLKIVAA